MTNLEMVHEAMQILGDVPAGELSDFVTERFGVRIESKFIPLYKASIRDKLRLETARQATRVAAQQPATKGNEP
ncbi:hypothetical protein AYO44_15965 [Planctomycetaceae bacterium SCGC AG-212-F19]|nr:hypothetical protein AYO44_15965 [Planctomycetaceae bacterium SCGC AG-212-F19]